MSNFDFLTGTVLTFNGGTNKKINPSQANELELSESITALVSQNTLRPDVILVQDTDQRYGLPRQFEPTASRST